MTSDSVGAMWVKKTKAGDDYFSIQFVRPDGQKSQFVAFLNDKGDNPARPDYKIFKSTPRDGSAPNNASRPNNPAPRPAAASASPASGDPDFIPF